MFDRFSDRSKKVMYHARQQAQRLNHDYIGTEHLLLGLVDVSGSGAAQVLDGRGIDGDRVREEVEGLVEPGPAPVSSGQLPFTPRAKRALELTLEEAARLGHARLGTEHLLLGLVAEGEGTAGRALRSLGLGLDDAREKVVELHRGRSGRG